MANIQKVRLERQLHELFTVQVCEYGANTFKTYDARIE